MRLSHHGCPFPNDTCTCEPYDTAELRTYSPSVYRHIAAGGGPRNRFEADLIFCPLCACPKSGCKDTPNQVQSLSCADEDCPCHQEEE